MAIDVHFYDITNLIYLLMNFILSISIAMLHYFVKYIFAVFSDLLILILPLLNSILLDFLCFLNHKFLLIKEI